MMDISANAQAILMLVAPLVAGGSTDAKALLTHREYTDLVKILQQIDSQPANLIVRERASGILDALERHGFDKARLQRLLGRGVQLGLALEHWQQRSIQVVSRADDSYPQRLKKALGHQAPALLYVCGDIDLLHGGGMAVVGSRHVDAALLDYARQVGEMAAGADCTVVSGGAKGVDEAAMQGAAAAEGSVVGVLANNLEVAVMRSRDGLMNGRLLLCSPFDPAARFEVWRAMNRNKLIYALSDIALVVESDVGRGGTWRGAVEQIQKYRAVPVYTRMAGSESTGLTALRKLGALKWPEFDDNSDLHAFVQGLQAPRKDEPAHTWDDKLFTNAEKIILEVLEQDSMSRREVGAILNITPQSASLWLNRLLAAEKIEKLPKPTRYRSKANGPITFAYESGQNPGDRLFKQVEKVILQVLDSGPLTREEVESSLAPTPKIQIHLWLREMLDSDKIEKISGPVRFQIKNCEQMFLV